MDNQSPDNQIPQTTEEYTLGPLQSSAVRFVLVSATLLNAMIITALASAELNYLVKQVSDR
jgi:hypothetical protein